MFISIFVIDVKIFFVMIAIFNHFDNDNNFFVFLRNKVSDNKFVFCD